LLHKFTAVLIFVSLLCSPIKAQEVSTSNPTTSLNEVSPSITIPAGTKVYFKLDQVVTSKTAKPSDTFTLTVSSDVSSGSSIVIPVGTKASGEVIHAQKARGLGKAGELLVTIRSIDLNGQPIKMRAFQPFQGKNNSTTALAMSQVIGPFAGFIKGGEIEMPEGTLVQANVAVDTVIAPTTSTAPASIVTDDKTQNPTQ
jgi:hypothetical protein